MPTMLMLPPVSRLISELQKRDIPWCHWKSNRCLAEALSGQTDLDLLFPESRRQEVEEALADAGALKFRPVWFRDYPGIEDYIAVDPEVPALIHFHVHFRLVVGQKNIKAHHLPWEEEVLSSRIPAAPGSPVFIASHEMEMLLLLVRSCLKQPHGEIRLGPEGGAGREFEWLAERIDRRSFADLAERLLGSVAAEALQAIADSGPDSARLEPARPLVLAAVERHRRLSPAEEARVRWTRASAIRLAPRARRLGLPLVVRRVRPARGFAVALLGCDGSGKSSLARFAGDFFAQKLDVERIYFGHGASSSSAVLRLAVGIRRRFGRTAMLRQLLDLPVSAVIACEKLIRFLRLDLTRRAGALVICDRFPQTDVPGICDGPRLPASSSAGALTNTMLKPLAGLERAIYSIGDRVRPDLVIKINVPPQLAFDRKHDGTSVETIARKIEVIDGLQFADDVRVVRIENAGIPFEQAAKSVVAVIWKAMGDAAR